MKEKFIEKRFRPESLEIIRLANQILDEYSNNRIQLTLRQLYYQFIARDLLPDSWIDPMTGTKNNMKNYKKLGVIISDAREGGLIDWNSIEDRARHTMVNTHWSSGREIIEAAAYGFYLDKWSNQPYHIEVMAEKDAATSVIWPVCRALDVRFTANKGYGSSTMFYDVGKRIARADDQGKKVTVLYVGDHDPSGIDMTRDVEERLSMYSYCPVEVIRLALNFDQVQLWNPPENPAKEADPRAVDYIRKYGDVSWELDAVEPLTLRSIIENAILARRNDELLADVIQREKRILAKLHAVAQGFKE